MCCLNKLCVYCFHYVAEFGVSVTVFEFLFGSEKRKLRNWLKRFFVFQIQKGKLEFTPRKMESTLIDSCSQMLSLSPLIRETHPLLHKLLTTTTSSSSSSSDSSSSSSSLSYSSSLSSSSSLAAHETESSKQEQEPLFWGGDWRNLKDDEEPDKESINWSLEPLPCVVDEDDTKAIHYMWEKECTYQRKLADAVSQQKLNIEKRQTLRAHEHELVAREVELKKLEKRVMSRIKDEPKPKHKRAREPDHPQLQAFIKALSKPWGTTQLPLIQFAQDDGLTLAYQVMALFDEWTNGKPRGHLFQPTPPGQRITLAEKLHRFTGRLSMDNLKDFVTYIPESILPTLFTNPAHHRTVSMQPREIQERDLIWYNNSVLRVVANKLDERTMSLLKYDPTDTSKSGVILANKTSVQAEAQILAPAHSFKERDVVRAWSNQQWLSGVIEHLVYRDMVGDTEFNTRLVLYGANIKFEGKQNTEQVPLGQVYPDHTGRKVTFFHRGKTHVCTVYSYSTTNYFQDTPFAKCHVDQGPMELVSLPAFALVPIL